MLPPSATRWRCPHRLGLAALAFVLLTLLLPRFAAAGPPDQRPVITPGREDEILALFTPHAIGDELTPGWVLHSFRIEVATIQVFIVGPGQAHARLDLDHPNYGPAEARPLTGFVLHIAEQDPGSEPAVSELIATIEANDDGSFWGGEVVYAGEPRAHPITVESVTTQVGRFDVWLYDGLVFLVFAFALLLGLSLHKLRGAPRWIKIALPVIVLGGGALRLLLSPSVAFAAWPYTRALVSGARIYHGPALALLHPDPVWLSEMIIDSSLAYAALAPLAVYVHARYLLDDQRAALLAALIVALLPLHLRFSHSDAAFIPSITVSSTCFALVHAATRERSQLLGWFALALIGPLLALMYDVRPLNILYYPLLVATAFVNHGAYTDKPALAKIRTGLAFALATGVTFALAVPNLLEAYGGEVSEGLGFRTLLSAMQVIVSPRFNALLNPLFTPPGLTALAIYGAYELWKRGRRPLFYFLVAWLLGFLVAHAYVVPGSMYMQARYHLHLVVPYLLLAACGAEAGLRWLALDASARPQWSRGREPLLRWAGLIYVLLSPLIHLHGVRYTGFNDAQEWQWVHTLREEVPAECTVLEYSGAHTGLRFERVGAFVSAGVAQQRWQVVEIPMREEGEDELTPEVRALLEAPPECLYWYEGLPCFGNKELDADKAAACRAIEGWVELEEVASKAIESEPYDGNLAFGLGEVEAFELKLFRVVGRR